MERLTELAFEISWDLITLKEKKKAVKTIEE